jgi:hypothetical protein
MTGTADNEPEHDSQNCSWCNPEGHEPLPSWWDSQGRTPKQIAGQADIAMMLFVCGIVVTLAVGAWLIVTSLPF